jgi:hypothetical protein
LYLLILMKMGGDSAFFSSKWHDTSQSALPGQRWNHGHGGTVPFNAPVAQTAFCGMKLAWQDT